MVTNSQSQANKKNAQKSTGPKTSLGKAASSANAAKHGLTTSPERAPVQMWYKIILDDLSATPDPFERNQRLKSAYSLAEAEARLEQVCAAENVHLQKLHHFVERRGQKTLLELPAGGLEDPEALEFMIAHEEDPVMKEGMQILLACHENRPAAVQKQGRVLARYRREAEAQRRRALRHWIECEQDQQG